MDWLFSLYVAATAFGGSLILVSLIFGGVDKDFDKDLEFNSDVDVDADADVEIDGDGDIEGPDDDLSGHLATGAAEGSEAIWLPFLSLRFWTFGLASFGLTGLLLSLSMVADAPALLSAVAAGGGIGTGAAWFFQKIKTDSVSGDIALGRYAGEEARVVLTVRPEGMGKIALQTMAGRIEMFANTRDAEPIERGESVIIANVRDGVADVSRLIPSRVTKVRTGEATTASAERAKQTEDPERNRPG